MRILTMLFTIQNVSIKFGKKELTYTQTNNLQYKMFLLNAFGGEVLIPPLCIYNTKCFY